MLEYFKTKWRRPKHKGVSGNYSTIVIITSIIIGSYYMSGGGSPQLYLSTPQTEYGQVLETQPKHGKEGGITFRELRMKVLPTGRPTPIPTFGPTVPPTATPTSPPAQSQNAPQATQPKPDSVNTVCSEDNVGIIFLVDNSDSMDGSKRTNVIASLNSFASAIPDDALVGVITFGDLPKVIVPLGKVRDQKAKFTSAVNNLEQRNGTAMRRGVAAARDMITGGKNTFANYYFRVIIISDGYPSGGPGGGEDPNTNPSVAAQVKSLNARIYSIAMDPTPEGAKVLQQASSTPLSTYYIATNASGNIGGILNTIKQGACQ